MRFLIWISLLFISANIFAQTNPDLLKLYEDFRDWRIVTQPVAGDDIPRVERPAGWTPDFSPKALENHREKYNEFRKKLDALPKTGWTREDSVDFLCLSAMLERVNWELNVLRQPHRNPDFYVHQTLGSVYELLLISSPMTDERVNEIIIRLNSFHKTVDAAKANLTEGIRPFAEIALDNIGDVMTKMDVLFTKLSEITSNKYRSKILKATDNAAAALLSYTSWLKKNRLKMSDKFSVGRENYVYFLKNVALIPYSPETLLAQGQQEWQRAVAFETFEKLRNSAVPEPAIFPGTEAQIEQAKKDEQAIRDFMEAKNIMSVPDWLQHYLNRPVPEYLAPFTNMGVVDDLTSETRLDENGISYIPEPSRDLSYFNLSRAIDPRPLIVHEGVPGHYFQMAISWKNPRPIRRAYIDSGANEGIGFYVEEMMHQFGLFDDRPKTREIIYNFMRLRALRVEVDIRLALGTFSIEQAGEYLAKTVPMDVATAVHEAGFFAYNPGQAITYQIGKLQIIKLLSDAKILQKENFDLRKFHDYLMLNGNVPIALLRWEYLGLDDEIQQFFKSE